MTDSDVSQSFSSLDEQFMSRALALAAAAASRGEVPVGAVLVDASGQILAEAANAQISAHDPSAHAEILALRQAGQRVSNYRFPGSTLYVTLEPCTMCCGALVHARVGRLVYATSEPKAGAVVSTSNALDNPSLNHRVGYSGGLLADESAALLREFFAARRAARKSSGH